MISIIHQLPFLFFSLRYEQSIGHDAILQVRASRKITDDEARLIHNIIERYRGDANYEFPAAACIMKGSAVSRYGRSLALYWLQALKNNKELQNLDTSFFLKNKQ